MLTRKIHIISPEMKHLHGTTLCGIGVFGQKHDRLLDTLNTIEHGHPILKYLLDGRKMESPGRFICEKCRDIFRFELFTKQKGK